MVRMWSMFALERCDLVADVRLLRDKRVAQRRRETGELFELGRCGHQLLEPRAVAEQIGELAERRGPQVRDALAHQVGRGR